MDPHPNVTDIDPDSFSCSFFSFLFLSWTIAHLRPTGCLAGDFMLSFKAVTEALKEVCGFLGNNCGWSPKRKPFMTLKVWGEASTNRTSFPFRKDSYFPLWTLCRLLLLCSLNSGLKHCVGHRTLKVYVLTRSSSGSPWMLSAGKYWELATCSYLFNIFGGEIDWVENKEDFFSDFQISITKRMPLVILETAAKVNMFCGQRLVSR